MRKLYEKVLAFKFAQNKEANIRKATAVGLEY